MDDSHGTGVDDGIDPDEDADIAAAAVAVECIVLIGCGVSCALVRVRNRCHHLADKNALPYNETPVFNITLDHAKLVNMSAPYTNMR